MCLYYECRKKKKINVSSSSELLRSIIWLLVDEGNFERVAVSRWNSVNLQFISTTTSMYMVAVKLYKEKKHLYKMSPVL